MLRPILFSGPMVRAILAGAKTQTRRLVRAGHPVAGAPASWAEETDLDGVQWWVPSYRMRVGDPVVGPGMLCPYGQRGGGLWVRETWARRTCLRHDGEAADMPCTCRPVIYRASAPDGYRPAGGWRPSIFMKRVDSRIKLQVTAVRVARLHTISAAEVRAEGVEVPAAADGAPKAAHLAAMAAVWDRINGARAGANWDVNPWVWAVAFQVVSVA